MLEHITAVVVVVIAVLVVFCSCFRHHNFIMYYRFLLRNTRSAGYNTATVGLSPCMYYGRLFCSISLTVCRDFVSKLLKID